MGSPASAVIANLVMEDVEQRALASVPVSLLYRYSAATFNSIEPSIQFTVEREINGHLAFLDLNVHRTVEGKLETDVYRKPTHTHTHRQILVIRLSSPSKPP